MYGDTNRLTKMQLDQTSVHLHPFPSAGKSSHILHQIHSACEASHQTDLTKSICENIGPIGTHIDTVLDDLRLAE